MNRAEIIKAIAEAGASFEDADELQKFLPAFYAFEKIVAAKERERCAKVCEDRGNRNRIAASLPNGDRDEFYCADDIRALGGE